METRLSIFMLQQRGTTNKPVSSARDSKVIIHIDGGLHSSEVTGGRHSIALAYKPVSAKNDSEIDAILNNVIPILPWSYQEHVGHDNNRGGYMMNIKEEQVMTRTEIE